MKPKQLCYWSEVSSSPHKAVGSHILAGFIFTLSVLRRCSGGKRRNSEGTNLILSLSPTVLCGERNFPSGPLNASHLQTVVLQYLCKIRTASPCSVPPAVPSVLFEHSASQPPAFDLAHTEPHAVLGSWTEDDFQLLHKGYFEHCAKDLGGTFFKKTNTFCFQSQQEARPSFTFFPLPVLFLSWAEM